jgi:hypothetical protein
MVWANMESPCMETVRRAGFGERERDRKNRPF